MQLDNKSKPVLAILHSNYLENNAGVEKVVLEQQKICMDLGHEFFVIFPKMNVKTIKKRKFYIRTNKYILVINGKTQGTFTEKELNNILNNTEFKAILIHHLKSYSQNNVIIEKLKDVKYPIYYYIHDYHTICENHTLLKNNKSYCGCDGIKFRKCINCRFFILGKNSNKYFKKLFKLCKNIKLVFPSEAVKEIWISIFGEEYRYRCIVIPNQKESDDTYVIKKELNINKIKVAYVGYQNRVKGWDTFKKLSELNSDILDLYVIGSCTEKLDNVKIIPVSFTTDGQDAMINAIKENNIDIAFLWSIRPETYGFTFYESYVAGTYIITNKDSGNIAFMSEKLKCGKVFNDEEELIEFFKNKDNLRIELIKYFKYGLKRPRVLLPNDEVFNLIYGN